MSATAFPAGYRTASQATLGDSAEMPNEPLSGTLSKNGSVCKPLSKIDDLNIHLFYKMFAGLNKKG